MSRWSARVGLTLGLVALVGCGGGNSHLVTVTVGAAPSNLPFIGGTVTVTAVTNVPVSSITATATGPSGTLTVPLTAQSGTTWQGQVTLPQNLTNAAQTWLITVTASDASGQGTGSATVTVTGIEGGGPPAPEF